MAELTPSLLAADLLHIGRDLENMMKNGVNRLHFDVMDAHFVPNLSFSPALCAAIKEAFPSLTVDAHLMRMFPEELKAALKEMGEKPFRAGQLFSWLHRGARFEEMTSLPVSLREKLAESGVDQPVAIRETRVSGLDGTKKFLYALRDGNCVEGVLMRYHYGATLCVSTRRSARFSCWCRWRAGPAGGSIPARW